MNDYAPASSLGWLDFDDAARDKVSEALRALDEPATLDVLGLGTVRDAFADMLTPGTSTVQTRLRYFLFVAWILKGLEDARVPPTDFARECRDGEAKLMDCLRHLGPRQGVIGYWAGRKLRRMPSDIYWGGLVAWGIRRLALSAEEYAQHAARIGRHRSERDDDGNTTAPVVSMWADLPPLPDRFLEVDITFELEPHEAEFLVDRIRLTQPDSLLAGLSGDVGSRQEPVGPVVGAPTNHPDEPTVAVPLQAVGPAASGAARLSLDQFDYPWQVPMEFRGRLDDVLRHGRCFSELTLGPQLVYSLLLAQRARERLGRDTEELEAKEQNRLKAWATMVEQRHGELSTWVDERGQMEFREILAAYNISPVTLNFWAGMAWRAVDDPDGFAQDSEVRCLVVERERSLKRQRARLSYTAALENWGGGSAAGQLDYRWHITKQYLGELADATTPQPTDAGEDQADAGRPGPAGGGMQDRGAGEGSDRVASGEGV